jgi:ferredoxin
MRPVIDHDDCIGCGQCEQVYPEVFELGDDGFAHVINEEPAEDLASKVEEAIEECPTAAISWEEK